MTTKKTTAKKNSTFSAPIAEVHLVPLHLIDVVEQVRTEFDQESIEELANDIAIRGMMQPVLLNPNGDRFTLIAGERRLRATKHNGQEAIPALLTKVTENEATLMQLAENVQREELSLQDEAKAIAKLYELLGSLADVAEKVKKSISWCAKRWALTQDGFDWKAKRLLEDGITEDLELLKAYSDLVNVVGWPECDRWDAKIRAGEANRNTIRAALKTAKANKKKAQEERETAAKVSHAKKEQHPPAPPAWTIEQALEDIDLGLNCCDTEAAIEIYQSWKDEERQAFNMRLSERYGEGNRQRLDGEPLGMQSIRNVVFNPFYEHHVYSIEIMAMIEGYAGKDMKVEDLLKTLQGEKVD